MKYFSSSKKVKTLIEQYGAESFTREIRKTFDTKDDAILWEERVLTKMHVLQKPNWLNSCVSKSIRYHIHPRLGVTVSEETKQKISAANTGKKRSDEHRKLLSEQRSGEKHWNHGNKWSDEVKQKNSESNKRWRLENPDKAKNPPNPLGRKQREETKQKIAAAKRAYWERRRAAAAVSNEVV